MEGKRESVRELADKGRNRERETQKEERERETRKKKTIAHNYTYTSMNGIEMSLLMIPGANYPDTRGAAAEMIIKLRKCELLCHPGMLMKQYRSAVNIISYSTKSASELVLALRIVMKVFVLCCCFLSLFLCLFLFSFLSLDLPVCVCYFVFCYCIFCVFELFLGSG